MRQYEHLQCGPDRLRVGPWRSDPSTAELAALGMGRPLQRRSVERSLDLLAARGFRRVVTNALSDAEQVAYLGAGFHVQERLHLLAHDLRHVPLPRHEVPMRRGRRRDHPAILGVDAAAFEPFWQLDELGLRDAIEATPSSRTRVVAGPGSRLLGYAVTGRAGTRGYLQRLAVDPAVHGQGIGEALVIDALGWLRRRRCQVALVNTQEVNLRALQLYERLGFLPRDEGLAVLSFEFHT